MRALTLGRRAAAARDGARARLPLGSAEAFALLVRGVALLLAIGAATTVRLLAHPGEGHAPSPLPLDTSWSWDPLALVPLAVAALVYGRGAWRLRRTAAGSRALPWWALASFALGWLTMAVALVSPVDTISDTLFSVHMGQHILLMLVAAPLVVLGRPLAASAWAVPDRWRRTWPHHAVGRGVLPAWRALTTPVAVWGLHAAMLWIWHAPPLFDATLRDNVVHAFQHLCFFGSAVLFWWSLVHGRHGRLGYGAAVVYVFTTAVSSSLLGALLTVARNPWYRTYVERGAGRDPLEDQQLAGLLMWVPAGAVLVVLALALFAAWLGEAARRAALGAPRDGHGGT